MSIKKINIGKGEKYVFEKHINEFLIHREDARLSEVFTVVVPINKSTHDQIHEDMEQIFVIQQGEGIIKTHTEKVEEEIPIKVNDIVLIPLDTYHQIVNTNKNIDLKYVCINAFLNEKKTEFTSINHADNVIKNYKMDKYVLNERPIVIVGAAGFIGSEIIRQYESIGKYIWAFDNRDIEGNYNRTKTIKMTNDNDFKNILMDLCQKEQTVPEILIDASGNNSIKKHSFNVSIDEFKQQLNDNIICVYSHVSDFAKICSHYMMNAKIILLGSIGGSMSHREMVGYDSAKGGLEAMTRSLALDYAPYNININTIEIGPIDESPSSKMDYEKADNLRKLLPIGNYPTLKEVCKFIMDFSNCVPMCITGQKLAIDGGISAQLRPVFIERLNEPNMYRKEK